MKDQLLYNKNPNLCTQCEDRLSYAKRHNKFCSSSCAATFNNKGTRRHGKDPGLCIECGKKLSWSGKKYCNHRCQNDYQYKVYVASWKAGYKTGLMGKYSISKHIKRYLFEKYDSKCIKCGWSKVNKFTNKLPLEIEHIDGDYRNCTESNLILLCPSCHSLTRTYKGANKGHGRLN
ncbi:MAG TPA: HNH endonuclease, partial [bacterium]|nr:HNH endonuclease [bacterium]